MKKTIPFTKEITFKNKILELTSISLDNDLTLKGEDLVVGNFYLNGTYLTEDKEEEYSYRIPCEIAISDEYDTFDSEIDIDDFTYQIKDDVLAVNITVVINNLEKKEKVSIEEQLLEDSDDRDESLIEEKTNNSFLKNKEDIKNEEDTYLTYSVYIVKESDTIETILEKYKITKEELLDYNSPEDIKKGSKLVIPSFNDKL